ncbi:MAG: hypothetical protein OEZ51_11700, partial [Nitrospinota bacterium]|nr:hypothetical protein [Nitrospinota bacterium]
ALQNARAGGNASVETPVSKSESAVPQATSASQPVTRPAPESGTPVAAASPALQNARAGGNASVATPVSKSESAVPQATSASQPVTRPAPESGTPVTAASPALQNARAGGNASVATPVSKSESAVPQATSASQPVTDVSGNPKTPFAVSSSQGLRELFMGSKEGNAENVRDINELVSSVVKNEFAAEAKKIFSKPKVIRTVADLADFILERLREIIATNQLKEKASPGKEL